jgi:hypothetical protein
VTRTVPAPHYHDSTGTEDQPCWCETPGTYAPAYGQVTGPPDAQETWTRGEVSDALNGAAEMVIQTVRNYSGERGIDLINLVINAAGHLLDNPGAGLDDVIEEEYGEEPATVKGWVR